MSAAKPVPVASGMISNIVNLFDQAGGSEAIPEVLLGSSPYATSIGAQVSMGKPGVDLSGRRKLIMAFGPGRSGKSTMLRWMIERGLSTGVGELALASADADRPTLTHYFANAMKVPSKAGTEAWLERLLNALLKNPVTTVIDFPADMTLMFLLKDMGGNLVAMIEQAGLSPVVFYMLTPRVSDLSAVDAMQKAGFRADATALVLNCGTTAGTADYDAEFAMIQRHSVFQEAVGNGAQTVWMPRLWCAKAIEERTPLSFQDAGKHGSPLSMFDQGRVLAWQKGMLTAFSGVESWLP